MCIQEKEGSITFPGHSCQEEGAPSWSNPWPPTAPGQHQLLPMSLIIPPIVTEVGLLPSCLGLQHPRCAGRRVPQYCRTKLYTTAVPGQHPLLPRQPPACRSSTTPQPAGPVAWRIRRGLCRTEELIQVGPPRSTKAWDPRALWAELDLFVDWYNSHWHQQEEDSGTLQENDRSHSSYLAFCCTLCQKETHICLTPVSRC